mmetsp:Transcript_36941/g.97325  ORF Transcript_36941/g.97325 Transcript_36941/m.97325 type:complete len:229 (-) Transcript_36941:266-952(-)
MEEKEHTFVPPHTDDAGTHITGHRFCSDCWVEFLIHGLRRQSAVHAPLACPVCRGDIATPDVWGACFDLPPAWLPTDPAARKAAVLLPSVAGDRCERGRRSSSSVFASAAERWADDATSSDDDSLTTRPLAMPSANRGTSSSSSSASSSMHSAYAGSVAADECTPREGGEEDMEGGEATPVAAPPCRRAWDAVVTPGLHCLSGVLRAAREVATMTTRDAMLQDSTLVS